MRANCKCDINSNFTLVEIRGLQIKKSSYFGGLTHYLCIGSLPQTRMRGFMFSSMTSLHTVYEYKDVILSMVVDAVAIL